MHEDGHQWRAEVGADAKTVDAATGSSSDDEHVRESGGSQ